MNDIDLSDEEINDTANPVASNDAPAEDFTAKLKKIIQLTGYSVYLYLMTIYKLSYK